MSQFITIGEVTADDLAARFGTPIFVYDEQKIRQNYRHVKEAFSKHYDRFKLYYAVKCNSNPVIARILGQEGAGMDTASVNEIKLAQSLGLNGENIIFSGNFLSEDDLRQGLSAGVIFNLDDISLFPRLLKLIKENNQVEKIGQIMLSFRINPGIGKSNVGYFDVTGGPEAKFGLHPDQVMEAYGMAKKAGFKRFGVHMMGGSCVTEPEYFAEVTERLLNIVGKVGQSLSINFEFIDLGGGLGIPYRPDEKPLDIDRTAELITNIFKQKIAEYNMSSPQLMMEPGRYFVGDAGYLIGTIHAVKDTYQKIYGSDLGMNIVPRIILYNAFHNIRVNGKENQPLLPTNICGQICEQTDLWGRDRLMPELSTGDILVMENCGAYCYGMSYRYNGRLLPAEILVNGSDASIIRKAETFEDYLLGVEMPDRLKQ